MVILLKFMLTLVSLTVCVANNTDAEGDVIFEWGYRDPKDIFNELIPSQWHTKYPLCGGTKQSPINVITSNTQYDKTMRPIIIKSNTVKANFEQVWKITNNGHTILLDSNMNYSFILNSEVFMFEHFHFHWRGSEHRINNHKFAGELHMVFRNLNATQEYCVFAFFLEVFNKLKLIRN